MKKFLLSVAALAALTTQAQVVVTEADFGNIGDKLFIGSDNDVTNLNLSVGNAGAGNTWNFASLQTDTIEELNFIDPQTLPGISLYPTANISFKQFGADAFVRKDAAGVEVLGLDGAVDFNGFNTVVTAPFNPTQTVIVFPAQLGTSFNDTSAFETKLDIAAQGLGFVDSVWIKRRSISESVMDAEGVLTAPVNSNVQAIRMNTLTNTLDSLFVRGIQANPGFGIVEGWQLLPAFLATFVGVPGAVLEDETRTLRFFGPNSKYYFVELVVDAQSLEPESARFQSDTSLCCTVGVSTQLAKNNNVVLYPNPAQGQLNVKVVGLAGAVNIELYNALGQRVATFANSYNTSSLPNGLYTYRAINNGKAVKTGRLVVNN